MNDNKLSFKGSNPGSVQYGNFINYYQFHPPESRLNLLPKNIWQKDQPLYCLDIGCNSGDLTILLCKYLTENVTKDCHIFGIDIDPILIERCNDKKIDNNNNIDFYCLDIMKADDREKIRHYLNTKYNIKKFNTIFCFSITMWIHLNHGDEGLKLFLREICDLGEIVIIEPQPWKCYKTAVKRLKLNNAEFPFFKQLKIKQNIEAAIEDFLCSDCEMKKIEESSRNEWDRKLIIYVNKILK